MPARFATARRTTPSPDPADTSSPALHVVARSSPASGRTDHPEGWFQADLAEFAARASDGSAEKVCVEVVSLAERWLPGMPAAAMLLADDAKALALRASSAWDPAFRALPALIDPSTASFGEEVVAGAVVRARSLNPESFAFDRHLAGSGIQGVLAVPLAGSRITRGGLFIGWRHGFGPSDAQVDLLRQVGFQAGALLEILKLQEQLDASNAALEDAQARLLRTQRLRSLGELSSGVAHQFNNALTTILGLTEWLSTREPDQSPLKADLAAIINAAENAAGIARRLELLSRDTSQAAVVQPVNMAEVVRTAPLLVVGQESAGARPVELVLAIRDVPPVEGTQGEMAEVVMSLVANATDAMPGGGRIELSLDFVSDRVVLRVADQGVGMTEDVLARAFEPFFTTKGPEAQGLGLTLSRSIAERRGGSLTCDSAPGSGTTVTLSLPAAAARMTPVSVLDWSSGDPGRRARPDRPLRIVLVDDEPDVRRVVGDMLRTLGHEVTACPDSIEALVACARDTPDVVITDHGMPGMDGPSLARALREAHPRLPVVLLTGWGAEPGDASQAAFSAVLGKPVTLKALRAALRPWVGGGEAVDSFKRGAEASIP